MDNTNRYSDIYKVSIAVNSLVVYKNLMADPIIKKFNKVLEGILQQQTTFNIVKTYYGLMGDLLEYTQKTPGDVVGNVWQNHLMDVMLSDENSFSLECESSSLNCLKDHFIKVVKKDLNNLKHMFDFDFKRINAYVMKEGLSDLIQPMMSEINEAGCRDFFPPMYYQQKTEAKKLLYSSRDWTQNLKDIADFYKKLGCGRFGEFWAFRWSSQGGEGELKGIQNPDPIKLEDLVGYESQRKEVVDNTLQFVKGYPANNLLLYGDRGTGKSSTIKALLHQFGKEGLRLIEISKSELIHLPQIIEMVINRPQRFIIFIDDLSFDEHETEYKHLKAILEGSLQARPKNVLVYATSNRRHLVREYFKDREETSEVGIRGTLQEKLSLSDRFGKTIVFPLPTQQEYLRIVEHLAQKRGINMDKAQLRKQALLWAKWNNEPSGRTARQFIDDLCGSLGFTTKNNNWRS